MNLFTRLSAFALIAALAAAGTSSASTMTKSHRPMMPVCKSAVVYAVAGQKIYYVRGESMFGHAKGGTYMCMAAANGKGFKKK